MSILISGGKSILKHQFTSKIFIKEKAISLIITDYLLLRNFVYIFTFLPVYQTTSPLSAARGQGWAPGGIWDCKYTDILLRHAHRDRPS